VDRVRLLELEVTDLERQLAEVTKQRDEWFELYTQTLKKLGDAREQIAKLITDV
jgi:phage shock protein A